MIILINLSKKCDVAIVTNGITSVQNGRLGLIDAHKYAKAIVISDQCGVSKPDVLIAETALQRLGCTDRSQALIIGDSISADIQLGINAGIDTCLMFAKSPLATYCASNYQEALKIV